MKRLGAFLFTTVFLIGLAALPHAAFAQESTSFFGPIIPESCHCDGTNGQPRSAPGWGCVIEVTQNVVNFAISFTIVIITLVIAWAGFLWMLSPFNPSGREQGRSMIIGGFVGLFIALSAWLIVNFVMEQLYDPSSFGEWHSILDGGEQSMCIDPTPDTNDGTNGPSGDDDDDDDSNGVVGVPSNGQNDSGATGSSTMTDASARSALTGAGFSIWSSGTCSENRAGCTYFGGVREATISTIVSLGNECGGGMTITAGSEPGHSSGTYSHANGYKIDIDDSPDANECITSLTSRYPSGDRGGDNGGTAYRDTCGNIYVRESNHWDARITSACTY